MSKIDFNFLKERDLRNLKLGQKEENDIILDPSAIIYRGYDQEYQHVDTLAWYEKNRPLFFGSFEHADLYSFRPDLKVNFPRGKGPTYRFWAKTPLNLFLLNEHNVIELLNHYLDQGDLLTAARLIFAYGFLYNIGQGYELLNSLRMSKEEEGKIENLLVELERKLKEVFQTCMKSCKIRQHDEAELAELVKAQNISKECYDFCWAQKSIGRTSKYDIDKPLISSLQEYLEPRGYQGILAWTDPEHVPKGYFDIIIFDPKQDLFSDNVDVNNCPTPKIKDCPKKSRPVKIPFKETVKGYKKYPQWFKERKNFKWR